MCFALLVTTKCSLLDYNVRHFHTQLAPFALTFPWQIYLILIFGILFYSRVSQNCEHNSMDSKNLSRCWWPTLFRIEFESFDKMTKYSRIPEEILQTLIEQCSFFFHSGNEI